MGMGAAVVGLRPAVGLAAALPVLSNACASCAHAVAFPNISLAVRCTLWILVFVTNLAEQSRGDLSGRLGGPPVPHMTGILLGGGTDVLRPALPTPFLFEWVIVFSAIAMAVAYPWKTVQFGQSRI